MKHIKPYPTQSELREIFDYREGLLIRKNSIKNPRLNGKPAGFKQRSGYIECKVGRGKYAAHRLIWIWHNGDIPEGLLINHKNEVRDDNRIDNLELVDNRTNRIISSKFKSGELPMGVSLNCNRKRFKASITVKGKSTHIGVYDTPEEAKFAYDSKVNEIYK